MAIRCSDYLQFLQHLYFGLHTRRSVGIVSEAVNEFLDMLPMGHLRLKLTSLRFQLFRSRFVELVVVATVHINSLRMKVQNVCWHCIQKVSVVRYYEQGGWPVLQVIL